MHFTCFKRKLHPIRLARFPVCAQTEEDGSFHRTAIDFAARPRYDIFMAAAPQLKEEKTS